ncbi:hypothetical protein [Psychrobacillus sp. NPDC096389]|uniref:hypothetical protein n=1 Tax=Psychrobacillus sp. NPDC096389 TaxID=3364490 RepID=UPI003804CD7E
MKYSTAKWIVISLGSASAIAIFTYFYLDEKDMMVPFLSATIKPFMMITMPPVIILLAAMLAANNEHDKNEDKDKDKDKEKRISGKNFKRALILIGALLSYKIFTGYFSK